MVHEKVDKWIQEQMENGKTREDLHNTYFIVDDESIAIIKKSGRKGFDLRILYSPHVVNLKSQ